MTVKVESCWGGGETTYFRLTIAGNREIICREVWDRKAATEALDLLENVYGIRRSNVRFIHR